MATLLASGLDDFDGPFDRILAPDDRIAARWSAALARVNKARTTPLKLSTPLDVAPELDRLRSLPCLSWPVEWPELARRCRTYPGDVVMVIGGSGSGKTQWGIQAARAFVANGQGCVLWVPLELTPVYLSLRVVANLTGTNVSDVRDGWDRRQIEAGLATVTDRWRFVDTSDDVTTQLADIDAAVVLATEIYGKPPLLVVDYVQQLCDGDTDRRPALIHSLKRLRRMTEKRGCYTLALSQGSRAGAPALTGLTEIDAATQMLGAGAETSEIENVATNLVVLNVYKADDAPSLDAQWLIPKARHSGLEGRIGARYNKRGGVWEELDHLPVSPAEVAAAVKQARKRGAPPGPKEPTEIRVTLNDERSEAAASARRVALIEALRAAGREGLGARDLRKIRGGGTVQRRMATLTELEAAGRVRKSGGRWIFVL